VSNSKRLKTKVETTPMGSKSRPTQRRLVGARLQGHPLRSKQQSSRAVNFCIWQPALPRSQPSRAMQVRKPIRRARSP
jgi:hypothetical protein